MKAQMLAKRVTIHIYTSGGTNLVVPILIFSFILPLHIPDIPKSINFKYIKDESYDDIFMIFINE